MVRLKSTAFFWLAALLLSPPAFSAEADARPDDAGLEKLRVQFEKQSAALSRELEVMSRSGGQCGATFFGTAIGPRVSQDLVEKKPSSDGRGRNNFETIVFQREQVNAAVKALLAQSEASAAKSVASGNGANFAKETRAAIAALKATIERERSSKSQVVAEGLAKRTGYFGSGAIKAVRDETGDAHCQATVRAIDASDRLNNQMLDTLAKLSAASDAFAKGSIAWAGSVKKAAEPAPAPAPPAAPVKAPAPAAPTPSVVEVACEEAPAQNTLPIGTALEAVKKLAEGQLVPLPPRRPIEFSKTPEAATPAAAAPAPAAKATVAPPVPSAPAATSDLSALFSKNSIIYYQPDAFKVAPAPSAAPAPAAETPAPKAEAASAATAVAPYDASADLWWDGKKPIDWKKLDRYKQGLGMTIPKAAGQDQLKALTKNLGSRLRSVEGRVRLQKAINEVALELNGSEGTRSPSVFQDGVFGSRTRNAAAYYYEQHREAFEAALRRQGLQP